MKKVVLFFSILVLNSCFSQEKKSLKQMNEYLLKDNYIYYDIEHIDSTLIEGVKSNLLTYRLLGAKSCHIIPDKKYSHIYIEDGFHDEEGFYNGIIVLDNHDVCEITTSPYKLHLDSLSYTKVKVKAKENDFIFYTKKISMEDFKEKYQNEYFRYELVIHNKVSDLKKCLEIDKNTPKPKIYAKSYYFTNKKINSYGIVRVKYNDIKNGIEGLPNFNEEKKKEFMDCINNLGIIVK
ncbi:hypothetical protein PGH12_04715 [Chryseobacterium wangxinyae]|uniref:hypothetical protein n=1 Tax=Chryseobacterium sp. CY350 TaxID=2997336 RepID=UPI00226FDAD5|nr:hypothetical protein [Chryseobacterium sp. CY350]MCY0979409.1 hypothetical protein [Chryseobacterium sp. CY350]WBZ96452.1 hypothetical protein PGH12_04715 [Chryseobacterium sp. CY350]